MTSLLDIVLITGCIVCCIVALLSRNENKERTDSCEHEWSYGDYVEYYSKWPYYKATWRKCKKCGREEYFDFKTGWTVKQEEG